MTGRIRDRFNRRCVLQALGVAGVVQISGVGAAAGDGNGDGGEPTACGETIDWQAVGQAIGKQGELKEGCVYSVGWPRTDLNVTSEGVLIDPALALGSHAEFFAVGESEVILRGDLVLTEEESDRVISKLQEGGVGQTAIHKHLPDLSRPIWWTHIAGRGDPVEIARTINAALELTGTPMESAGGCSESGGFPLDTERLDDIMGSKGKVDGGVYKYSIPYGKQVTIDGVAVPPAMGTAMPLNFQPTGDGTAAINGDFIMMAEEVNSVIRALRNNDIRVVSLHNHFLTDEPRLFFMHFWATDDATKLTKGLRAALDETDTAKASGG